MIGDLNPKLFNHLKSIATSDNMAHYQHNMRILMHNGVLEDFNKYDDVVEKAKAASDSAGKQIKDADKTAHSVSKMISDLKSNPVGTLTSSLGSALGFRQKKAVHAFVR